MAWRSLFLQGSWNYQRLQNLGFCYAILPALQQLYRTPEARLAAVKRHLEFFNTHPYSASLILGVVARLEEKAAAEGEPDSLEPNRVKVGMMGPLAALGDAIFWAGLKPALALLGTAVVLLSFPRQMHWALWGPALFLGLYSLAHLALRVGGVFAGYHRGVEVVKDLRRFDPQAFAQRVAVFGALVLGAAAAAYAVDRGAFVMGSVWASVTTLVVLAGLMFLGLRRGLSASQLFYGLVAAAVVATYAGLI